MHSQHSESDSSDAKSVLHPYQKHNPTASAPGTHAIANQAGEVVADVKELGRVAVAEGERKLGELREQGNELVDQGRKELENAQARVEKFVRESPVRAVLYAAGAGFLASLLLRR